MRVLISGLIGAAASAAAWFYLEHATGHEMGWLAIAVGLITGLCVNAAAGPSARESTGRAALAAILALAAIVGGRVVYAKVMQNISQVKNVGNVVAQVDEVEAEDDAGDEVAAVEVDEEPLELPAAGTGKAIRLEKPTVDTVSEVDFLYMGIAALAAYITGKGRNPVGPVDAEATEPPVEPDGEPSSV
ncbi:hypothetical protein Pr1d_43870 [Bythopirellula goksoeyrii]|uniref:Transmembrane protein n=2 Tax=Bythopirellula goksoeyrii TaxID=1400387 RepID=A0A5B9QDB1_9BACT|nr:hypothetical protein Pr1d_43870 [Bythopirellula goksoeyrii]